MENVTHPLRAAEGRGRCRRCGGAEEFGVTIDLSRFYSDERAQVLARACGRRRARWLLARVARALALPPPVALLAGGRLLPPAEPLHLLRASNPAADTLSLQVIPLPEHWHGVEGLRDFTCSTDSVDAPVPELNSTIITCPVIQPEEQEMEEAPEPACEVQAKHEPESNHCDVAELQRVKERALALLESWSGPSSDGTRRPRVRRRRRRRAPEPESLAVALPSSLPLPATAPLAIAPPASPPPAPAPVSPAPPPEPRAPRSPSVRRNRSPPAATTPRLVRALC